MITIQEKRQEQIDEIMDNFDFERVHKVMQALNWSWRDASEAPSLAELRKVARNHLKSLPLDKDGYCTSGGFYAGVVDVVVKLAFEVEDWSAE